MRVLKVLLPLLVFLLVINCPAYSQRKCGTDHRHQQKLLDPDYRKIFEENRERIKRNMGGNRSTIKIPVAIHFNGAVTSANMCCLISSSLNQIAALNSDFNSTNPDISIYTTISNVCPQLYPITSLSQGMNVEFYIANSNHPPSSGLNEGDYAITVGQEEFPSAGTEWGGYFNIFVDDDWGTSSAIGESSAIQGLTGSGSGVVIHPSVFGGPGASCTSGTSFNTDPSLNLGRTLTHEAGHYFGLYHIFNGCTMGMTLMTHLINA